jgi:hypothetical protein
MSQFHLENLFATEVYFIIYLALGLEDYKDVVKKPMDLNMIRRNNN